MWVGVEVELKWGRETSRNKLQRSGQKVQASIIGLALTHCLATNKTQIFQFILRFEVFLKFVIVLFVVLLINMFKTKVENSGCRTLVFDNDHFNFILCSVAVIELCSFISYEYVESFFSRHN